MAHGAMRHGVDGSRDGRHHKPGAPSGWRPVDFFSSFSLYVRQTRPLSHGLHVLEQWPALAAADEEPDRVLVVVGGGALAPKVRREAERA